MPTAAAAAAAKGLRRALPAAVAATTAVAAASLGGGRRRQPCRAEASRGERVIREEEVRRHNTVEDAWISFHGCVYDISRFAPQHPPCPQLAWAERVAGRRFEHFLGRDAFGPAHQGCGPDANCCSKDVRKALEQILLPFRLGTLEPLPMTPAARSWPDVSPEAVELRVEYPDGSLIRTLSVEDLRSSFPRAEKVVTHKCTSTGNTKTQHWAGVRVRDLLPTRGSEKSSWEPLVTFVGMDGFGYSVFWPRAVEDDVILAYEQGGSPLDTEGGGPLRLVKNGQHAKWVERIVIERACKVSE